MKTIGIIAEYNPFHTGHLYQIQQAKQQTGADTVIIVMSGNFVQRGEPALLDKWTRTSMALQNGADIVLELPVLYATASAEYFAHGAVKLLEETGIVDTLCFGSECGDIQALQQVAAILTQEPETFRLHLKTALSQGNSYAAARSLALEKLTNIDAAVLSAPNNILGVEYLKALHNLHSTMIPHTILRAGAGYHATSLEHTPFASASGIRASLRNNRLDAIWDYIPQNCHAIMQQAFSSGKAPVFPEDFTSALHYCLRSQSPQQIQNIFEVTEGIENRIYSSLATCHTLDEIIAFVKTKRYPYTRIQRILLHILLGITKEYIDLLQTPPYLRVLGFHRQKQHLLGKIQQNSNLPLLTNLKHADALLDTKGKHLLALEQKATDLYTMVAPNPNYRTLHQELTTPMVMISSS